MTRLDIARRYVLLGLSVIPIRPDGSKTPALDSWHELQDRKPTDAELADWFGGNCDLGIAVVCGKVSRNLEVIDFDDAGCWDAWRASVEAKAPDMLPVLARVKTPRGGMHVYLFRSFAGPSRKLAQTADKKTLIEIKGEGGYVLAPGSAPACHATGKEYEWVRPLPGM